MGLVKEVIKEIGNKSREFYEFVLPPIDMHLDDEKLKLIIDIPGFVKEDINLTLCGDILSIKAKKNIDEKQNEKLVCNQRPNIIDKKIRIPLNINQGEMDEAEQYMKKGKPMVLMSGSIFASATFIGSTILYQSNETLGIIGMISSGLIMIGSAMFRKL